MRAPHLNDGDVRLYLGDCIEVMAEMDADSVDAVVCDPPYGLEFMGKAWDRYAPPHFETWCKSWAREALRVLKPGGHLLAFGGTRTFHRLTCGIEDAGFEVRDCLSWLYGSGFPKSLDVSEAIDKAAGAERPVVGERKLTGTARIVGGIRGAVNGTGSERYDNAQMRDTLELTAPATPDAVKWQGWGTALKPAWEPCVVARKPLAGTVAQNVLEHGTGAMNVDGCRVGHASDDDLAASMAKNPGRMDTVTSGVYGAGRPQQSVNAAGRWPANVALDEAAAAMLDAQSGVTTSGASRFLYTAKASRADRNTSGANNTHPTVKPTELMRWLVRLVTPPGGVVLDPFAGSGSTLVAARAEGVRAIGIEREPEYAEIIAARLSQLSLFSEAS